MHLDHQAVLALAREFRERAIPCDVLGLEPGWQTHAYSCSFAWDTSRFPDPKAFLAEAAAEHFRVNLWEHAFTHPSSPIFAALRPYSGDFAVWEGLVPDFAGEPARRVFGEYHGRELIDAGVSGFKLDECDNSDFTSGWSFPDMSRFPSGLDGEQMHAVFGLRYQHAIWQPFQARRQATYGLVRSSGALAAPYPFVLYSDLYDHREFVRGVVSAGFSGLLWCPEVRDASSEEDLIRRLQTVVFSPLAMVNAWYIKNPPWKQIDAKLNNGDTLAPNWAALEQRCREIIGWRMQLVPYLLSAFERYALDGTPPFRALAMDYPQDKSSQFIDDQYMIGDRMFVAPLFAGETERQVTFPPGEWHDFWTGEKVSDRSISVPASADKIPVFVKTGSVLPLATVGSSSSSPEARQRVVQVYGDGNLPWRMTSSVNGSLELSWDAVTGKGRVQVHTETQRPYRILEWRRMR
jgi:alpha-D-xyloside xylohydrolase